MLPLPPPTGFDPDIELKFDILGQYVFYYPDGEEICEWSDTVDYVSVECTDDDAPFGPFHTTCSREWWLSDGTMECTCLQLGTCTNCEIVFDYQWTSVWSFNVTADCGDNAGSSEDDDDGATATSNNGDNNNYDSLAQFGFPYTHDSATGWISAGTLSNDGQQVLSFDVLTSQTNKPVEECASLCQAENAASGAYNTRDELCWCYLFPLNTACLEPCIPEEGVEFSTISFENFDYCDKSWCDIERNYNFSVDYCDEFFEKQACDAKLLQQLEGSTTSSCSIRWNIWLVNSVLALFIPS